MRSVEIGGEWFSVIGLGGFELGDDPVWSGARDVLLASIEAGVDWIDTAEQYSDRKNETVIAAALRDVGQPMKLSSKVAPLPDGTGFEPKQIREACEGSLERLDVDRLDMYLMHYPGESTEGLEDSWGAMRALVDDGLTRLVGLSNFERPEVERCLSVGPVDVLQEGLSLIDHLETLDLARWCAEQQVGVVTYEPLGDGMLAGAITSPDDFARMMPDYREWGFWQRLFAPGKFERSEAVADGMRSVAERIGCSLPQLALAWNLQQTGVSATLAGTRSAAHARSNAEAADVVLSAADLADLDALIPIGPTQA
ncbi:MAG TPA: aldo/keto reductase [Actinomycetota bacterium]|nr:aldo/keto reductase [Actinomycetota bacterium]